MPQLEKASEAATTASSLLPEYPKGAQVWIRDDELVWRGCEIQSTVGEEFIVKWSDDDTESRIPRRQEFHLRNKDVFSWEGLVVLDDLTQLQHLHEPALLHALQIRFDTDKIYTFTGPILIAMNPFKRIPGLYDIDRLERVLRDPACASEPHVFAVSNYAFRGLCDTETPQTVLISGESGAGKTETTKFVMKFLALAGAGDKGVSNVEKKVLESNPVLEAFGNARTLRNDNSSRFGKFIQLQFKDESRHRHHHHHAFHGPRGSTAAYLRRELEASEFTNSYRLAGAKTQTYLLEKVRVCDQQEGERNYHIFYQCAAAAMAIAGSRQYDFPQYLEEAPCEAKIDLTGFSDVSTFNYLTKSSTLVLDDVDDVEQFEVTVRAMLTVGISVGEINSIMNIIAAVLRLGNIRFRPPNGDSDASELDPASEKDFLLLMRLLGLDDAEAFIRALTTKTITTRMEVYHTPVSVHTAVESCDSLARQLYGLLFLRVVSRTNDSIGYDPKANLFCGVLDIFGFECFKQNSFEQLCINYTNERLQQFFNNFIFKMEEQLYAEEGIAWDPLDFPDNQDAVDLLADSRMGIFSLLDEECVIPGGSDKNFCSKLCHRYKEHRRFDIVKTRQDCFVVNHFAGPVEYDTEGFMDKNKDQMSYSLFKVMKGSSSDYVSTLFTEYEDTKFQDPDSAPSGKSKKKLTTISGEFKQQLNELMETVRETEPHFIRCIKPNPMNLPDVYDRPSVCEQLRYGGVLQAIQVSRAGYPVRISHEDCWLDYMQLVKGNLAEYSAEEDMSKRCLKLLTTVSTSLGIEEGLWEVGKTLVFFKQKAFDALQNARMHLRAEAATRIQAQWRGLRTRAWYGFAIICLVKMQALVRGKMARIRVANMRREVGALRIQSWWRMEKQRIAYEDTLRKVIFIQAVQRGRMARVFAKEYRINTAAARIQAVWKGWHVRRQYCALRASALAAQRQFRMRAAKMQLRRLKQEAKEVGSLLAKYQNAQAEVTMVKRKLAETEALLLQSKSENQQLKVGRETLSQRIVVLEGQLDAAVKKHEEEMEQLASQHTDELAAVGGAAALVGGAVAGGAGLSMSASGGPNATVAGGAATLSRVSSPRVSPTTSISSPTMSAAGLETATVASGGEAASVVRLRQSLVDANSKSEGLESENERLKQELARVNKEREESEAKYQTMLKNTVYQSQASTHQGPAQSRAVSDATGLGARNVDIQLVGPQGVGKSPLLAGLIQQLDPSKMAEFERNRSNLMAHYQLQFKDSGGRERVLKVLDCNGNKRAQHLVREWFARSRWVICVYDMSSKDSLRQALELMKEGGRMGANVLLFGNLQSVQAGKATAQVDVMKAKDAAASANALAVEGNRLMDAVRLILSDLDANRFAAASASPRAGSGKETVVSTTGSSASSSSVAVAAAGGGATPSSRALRADSHASSHTLSGALETFKGWFKGSDNKVRRSNGVLKASLRGNKTMRERGGPNKDPAVADIRPVQEIQDSETAVTCIAFGQEKLHRSHILLAAASKDGTVVVYRCYRTEMELARLDPSDFPNDDASEARQEAAPGAKVVLHSRLVGHSRAITSMFFNLLEDTIVTTSIDKSVRFWMVDTGEMLKVFTDSSPVPVACFLPFNPQVFVAANSNAVLRLVNVQNGLVLQKLKVETEVRCLRFDDTGLFLLAGTKNGAIHVLEASDSANLKFKFKFQLSRAGITCITFVSGAHGNAPMLLVNTSDSNINIIDCTYGPPPGVLTNLTVRHRLRVAHSLLPIKSCYSPSEMGYCISGSEDKGVYIYSLAKTGNYRMSILHHHTVPVVAVATNQQDSLLASADSLGKIVLWRRVDFSHLEPASGETAGSSSQGGR